MSPNDVTHHDMSLHDILAENARRVNGCWMSAQTAENAGAQESTLPDREAVKTTLQGGIEPSFFISSVDSHSSCNHLHRMNHLLIPFPK
jgi:hypothetical protein